MLMKAIRDALAYALEKEGVVTTDVPLEHTADFAHGDYASSAALVYAKQLAIAPRALAEKIVAGLGTIEGVSRIEIAGPGFINFTLSPAHLAAALEEGRINTEEWGGSVLHKGKKIIVEYTDPNPFKEFHIGHLMSNAIGESIARLHMFAGAEVKRACYQGDVGLHVAKAIWGYINLPDDVATRSANEWEKNRELSQWGIAYKLGSARYEEPDGKVKAEIIEINKKVYSKSDTKINEVYDLGRSTTLAHFEELYAILGTKFDFYFFESATGSFGKEIVQSHIDDGVFKVSEGATVYEGEKKGLHTRVFLNSEGLPTYEAKELGLSKMKYEKFPYDTSVIVTGNEINEYFKVLLAAMADVFPELAAKTRHISHGMMRLQEGKMSSRTGNVVTGESLLNDLTEVARGHAADSRADDKEKLAEEVAVAAIKFQILKGGTSKDIIFDRERALSVEGDSGPYLQYAHARTRAIMEKAKDAGVGGELDASLAPSELARIVYRFHDIVLHAQKELEPHIVANYLITVASAFNSWYAQEQILDGTPAAAHKVALTDIVRITLQNGLWLLGIPAPEKV